MTTKMRTYKVMDPLEGEKIFEYDPVLAARQARYANVKRALRRVVRTHKRHFRGKPPCPHAINIALWKIGNTTRVTSQPAFQVALETGVTTIPTTNTFGRTKLRTWVLDALRAEEALLSKRT